MSPDDELPGGAGDEGDEIVRVAIGDKLDLHTFQPRDVRSLVPEYLDECVRLGLREVRIVHGKGRGVLRRAVQAALERHPCVVAYRQADDFAGGWGATLVTLAADDPGGVSPASRRSAGRTR